MQTLSLAARGSLIGDLVHTEARETAANGRRWRHSGNVGYKKASAVSGRSIGATSVAKADVNAKTM